MLGLSGRASSPPPCVSACLASVAVRTGQLTYQARARVSSHPPTPHRAVPVLPTPCLPHTAPPTTLSVVPGTHNSVPHTRYRRLHHLHSAHTAEVGRASLLFSLRAVGKVCEGVEVRVGVEAGREDTVGKHDNGCLCLCVCFPFSVPSSLSPRFDKSKSFFSLRNSSSLPSCLNRAFPLSSHRVLEARKAVLFLLSLSS